jgi:RNA polymerase sigma-70 factor (ECF subfamily)
MTVPPTLADRPLRLDPESQAWLDRLRSDGPHRETALRELRALLLKAARFELRRRGAASGSREDEDLAEQSADDALVALLGKLGQFRGESRFTTWAYKFALYEAAVKHRRRPWREREVHLEADHWPLIADRAPGVQRDAEMRELLEAIGEAIGRELTPRQRTVLVAVTLQDVPIDVLAERMQSTRGALYKTLHDARRRLRESLAARGLAPGTQEGEAR